jgi:hypothetical protein
MRTRHVCKTKRHDTTRRDAMRHDTTRHDATRTCVVSLLSCVRPEPVLVNCRLSSSERQLHTTARMARCVFSCCWCLHVSYSFELACLEDAPELAVVAIRLVRTERVCSAMPHRPHHITQKMAMISHHSIQDSTRKPDSEPGAVHAYDADDDGGGEVRRAHPG